MSQKLSCIATLAIRLRSLVRVEHNGQVADLPLIVTKGTGPSLLGRNWLAALKLD